jgi:hypothetical protein
MKHVSVVLACLFLLVTAGCSQPSSQEAELDFCGAMRNVETALDSLQAIGPTSTIDQYNAAVAAVDTAVADLKTAAGDVEAARAAEVENAVNTFKTSVGTINDDTTLAAASATVNASAMILRQSFDETYAAVSCPAIE